MPPEGFRNPFERFLATRPELARKVLALNREGRELLDQGRLKQAKRKFREALSISPYDLPALHNLALCAYVEGDLRRGVEYAKKALKYDPDNVFAHCTLAQCFLHLEREAKAEEHMRQALALLRAPSTSGALELLPKAIEALAELGWDKEIYELFSEFKGEEDIGLVFDPWTWAMVGVAAANLGQWEQAEELWRRALEGEPELEYLELYIFSSERIRQGWVPPFRFSYDLWGDVDVAPEPVPELLPLVVWALWQGDEASHVVLEAMEKWDDPWSEELLRRLLLVPDVPDEVKLHAGQVLLKRGALEPGQELTAFLEGKERRVQLIGGEFPAEPSPQALRAFHRGLKLEEEGKLEEAKDAYLAAFSDTPGFVPMLVSLGNVCKRLGQWEDAERWWRLARSLGSQAAGVALAEMYLELDQPERALKLWEELDLESLPEEEALMALLLDGWLHLALGELERADESLRKFRQAAPPELRRLLQESGVLKRLKEGIAWDRELRERRRRRYLSRPIRRDIPLAEALSRLTKNQLIGICKHHGIKYGGLNKGGLVDRITRHLMENLSPVLAGLSPEEREALAWVAKRGGSVPLSALTEQYGDISQDSLDWQVKPPESTLGRLQLAGLLFLGREGEDTVAVIPPELRRRLPPA